ncbi:ATP-binding cassette sub-family A member 12 [Merluccius polli]|uniref:ATP-binding cassette sub-family A member 12 n=1 Tax=Merluccius polli TaxID=89951 RepID=A0AA47M289_MERPO|nr:ATP-binding cassette sub-family A member 12 [Merluccius polli]
MCFDDNRLDFNERDARDPELMAFLHQLRLLLWKNGLGVVRQPGWSLTVIIWPIIIFIILAVTRKQFPPLMKEPCYVRPRNLPSTGFFPFLQTLMCSSDSTCHNTSRLLDSQRSHSRGFPHKDLFNSWNSIQSALMQNSTSHPAEMLAHWNAILGTLDGGVVTADNQKWSHSSLMDHFNSTLPFQNTSNTMLEPLQALKRAMCTVGLTMVNTSSGHPLFYALETFCKSNNTVLEVSLLTLNQLLLDLITSQPKVVMAMAGHVLEMFDQLQNHGALWDNLLVFPLFSATSVDQALAGVEGLLSNTQWALHVFKKSFPEAGATLSPLHPFLAGGINLTHYMQKWPGRDVYITLGDIVMLHNDTLSEAAKQVLREIRIPLDKAIYLLLDQDTAHTFICQNSSSSFGLTTACMTGMVDMVLGWISPEKVAKQVKLRMLTWALLMWSKDVAPSDMTFVKDLLYSMMEGAEGGPQDTRRRRRSVDTEEPQNIDEDLFLNLGRVVIDSLKIIPDADIIIQRILRASFFSMHTTNLAINTLENVLVSILKDVHQLKNTYMMLMTNQSGAGAWMGQILTSTIEMVMEVLTPTGPLTCEHLMRPYEWLLHSECLDTEVWKAIICQNITNLEQSLAMEWWPLFHMVEEGYNNISSQQGNTVTLPMILSEWHKLCNNTMNLPVALEGMVMDIISDSRMSRNSTYDMTETLLQSVLLGLASLGKDIEGSRLWPQVSRYVHMAAWIVNYKPGNTMEPANCESPISSSVDAKTMDVYCNADVDWLQFVQATAQAMRSLPHKPEILISYLKGTVYLLEHIYGDILRGLIVQQIPQQIPDNDALSHYMINLLHTLHGFALKLTTLEDSDISNPDVMLPDFRQLLQSTGLTPLMPLLESSASFNASTALDVALKLLRKNQHLFTFNETDPTLPDLERLIMKLLSTELNLTLPLSLSMGHTLLTYSSYLSPEDLAHLQLAIQPYTKQTSAGFTEAVLSAMELLKKLTDAPDGDPTNIILAYVQQLQNFLVSALRLRQINEVWLASGQLNTAQVTNLHLVTVDLLQLLTPGGLQNLTQAGPNATQQLIMQKLLAFLPVEVQLLVTDLLQDVMLLESQMSFCTSTGQNCVASLSEIFKFLQQVAAMALAAEGNVTIQIAQTNPFLWPQSSLHMTTTICSLLLPQRDARHIQLIQKMLSFITLVMDNTHPTVAQVQHALRQSNLTLAELDKCAALFGVADINSLLVNIVGLFDVRQCFAPQPGPSVTVHCAMGLISRVTDFLLNLPVLHNESTVVFAFIPTLLNNSILDAQRVNFSGNPHLPIVQVLNGTLANVKMSLHQVNLNFSEVMQEISVLQGLLELASKQLYTMPPFSNVTMIDATYHNQLEIACWYLKKLENITSTSNLSSLLQPIYRMAELQVALQLASSNFSMFVNNQVMNLINNLEYPLDGVGVNTIGLTIITIVREQIKVILKNFELQNDYTQSLGLHPMCNASTLNDLSYQAELYLDIIRNWMKEPNVASVFGSMFHWGNSSLSTPGNNIHQLLQTVGHYLNQQQLSYFWVISNITEANLKALAVAEQPGGLQSDQFSDAVSEMVQHMLQSLNAEIGPLPPELQHNVLAITTDSLRLIVSPNMGYASARNISLQILRRAEILVKLTLPFDVADYLISGIQIITTYFEAISLPGGQDNWNDIILKEMQTIYERLPKNSTAKAYMTIVIDITHSLIQMLLNSVWPMFMEHLGFPSEVPPLMGFVDLAPVVEQIMNGTTNPGTWSKLQMMLNTLLSMLQGTSMWEDDVPVVLMIETILYTQVTNLQAQNELMQNLQEPLVTLIAELVQSINSSRLNLSVIPEQLQHAIELTAMAAGKANGTLKCSQVLSLWDPVREAAGLDKDTLRAWCQVSLQPVLQSSSAAQTAFGNLNINNATLGAANATAARLTKILHSLYNAFINNSRVSEQLITALCTELSNLQPLSPEVQAQWYQHLQDMLLQQSLSSLKMLSDQLSIAAPFLQAHIYAVEQAAHHLLSNLQHIQNGDISQDIIRETLYTLLHSLNLTEPVLPMVWGNFTMLDGPSLFNLMKGVVEVTVQTQVFGDAPDFYRCLERFVAANGTSLLAEEVAELLAWASATAASGADALPQLLRRMHAAFGVLLDIIGQMGADLPENTGLFGDLVWNLVHMVQSMAPPAGGDDDDSQPPWASVTWGYPNNGTQWPETSSAVKARRRRETRTEPMQEPMGDFMDLFSIDYPALFKAINVAPTNTEVLETAHMFLTNQDLNVVVKGVTQDMLGDEDTSDKDEAIDAMLGVLAYLTNPESYASPWTTMDLLNNAAYLLPVGFPFSQVIQNITRSLARESQENMVLLQQMANTASELLHTSMMDERYLDILTLFSSQVCRLENMDAVGYLMRALYVDPGQLCATLRPAMQILAQVLPANFSNIPEALFSTFIGDTVSYKADRDWTSALTDSFGFNISGIQALNVNITKPDWAVVREMLKNETAFVMDVQRHMVFDPHILSLLLNNTLPSKLAVSVCLHAMH